MINLRYHIVSLVAVFLALAIGVIAGTTVIDQGVVQLLRNQANAARDRQAALFAENDSLRTTLAVWDAFGESAAPALVDSALAGVDVVLIALQEADADLVAQVEAGIVTADGTIAGRLRLTDRWDLESPTIVERLGLAIGTPATGKEQVLQRATEALAQRLRSPLAAGAGEDVLTALEDAGFVQREQIGDLPFPPRESLFVFVGGEAPAIPSADGLVIPLLRLLRSGRAVVADPLGAMAPVSDLVRRDGDLRRAVGTVDHVDTVPGRLALVMTLQDLPGAVDHFGTRGADGIVPTFTG
ncbi:MAG TPA: copper transporter [Actinomycetota bacterium]